LLSKLACRAGAIYRLCEKLSSQYWSGIRRDRLVHWLSGSHRGWHDVLRRDAAKSGNGTRGKPDRNNFVTTEGTEITEELELLHGCPVLRLLCFLWLILSKERGLSESHGIQRVYRGARHVEDARHP